MNNKEKLSAADKSVLLLNEFEISINFSNKYVKICDLFNKKLITRNLNYITSVLHTVFIMKYCINTYAIIFIGGSRYKNLGALYKLGRTDGEN